jgi:hypothetical protein
MERDFDFLHGQWRVANRRLKQRLRGSDEWEEFDATALCQALFAGAANVDEFTFPGDDSGLTLRLYDPGSEQWSLYWATRATGRLLPPVVGTFTDGVGTFYGDDTEQGRPVRVRYIWSEITASSAQWEQAFSTDDEQTWETNWYMRLTRL